ncbi:MAG: hypothetical protein C6I00_04900 [Nitratiruptor sp.]|nr:hypothetical protein [Nitratiruptor sp.]NPA84248.1 hypothetical protein [Campylobacterota bacterium]
MRNEAFQIAINHLQNAREELGSCAQTVSENIETLLQRIPKEQQEHEILFQALTALQMQDIITQRLEKLKAFVQLLDKHLTFESSDTFLHEFAWENEVDQNDIDAMFTKA